MMYKLTTPEDIFKELVGSPLDPSRVVSSQGGYGPSVPRLCLFPFFNPRDEYFIGIHVVDSLSKEEVAFVSARPDFSHITLYHGQLTVFLKPEKKYV